MKTKSRSSVRLVVVMGLSVVCAVALTLNAWSSHQRVEAASSALIHGQAEVLIESFRLELRARSRSRQGDAVDSALLQETLESKRAEGLTFIALYDGRGRSVGSAGTASPAQRGILRYPGGRTVIDKGGWVRVVDRRGPPLGPPHGGPAPDGEMAPPRPPPFAPGPHRDGAGPMAGLRRPALVMEFEPKALAALRAEADRGLGFGIGGAVLLLLAAWLSVRLSDRALRVERRLVDKRELERLGEMSAVLAHEMRNPIAGIKGHLQLVAERFRDDPAARDKVQRVPEDSVRLEHLAESLLDFVRSGGLVREAVFPVHLLPPLRRRRRDLLPLRRRRRDLLPLAGALLARVSAGLARPELRLSPDAATHIMAARWPGNARELRNALGRAAILSASDGILHAKDMQIAGRSVGTRGQTIPELNAAGQAAGVSARTLEEMEKEAIVAALEATEGNRRMAAERLGIALRTLYNKLKRYGLDRTDLGQ